MHADRGEAIGELPNALQAARAGDLQSTWLNRQQIRSSSCHTLEEGQFIRATADIYPFSTSFDNAGKTRKFSNQACFQRKAGSRRISLHHVFLIYQPPIRIKTLHKEKFCVETRNLARSSSFSMRTVTFVTCSLTPV
jgi:hypothetical protein